MATHAKSRCFAVLLLVTVFSLFCFAAGHASEDRWNVDLMGRWIGGPCNAVAAQNSIAFAGTPGGLVIVDLTSPDAPVELAQYALPGRCFAVYVDGPYAYVADGTAGLRIVDVSVPVAPQEVGWYDTDGSALDVVVAGAYAYVADYNAGLRIIDVSDPTAPFEVGFFDGEYAARGVAVQGDHAYIAEDGAFFFGALRAINISNPAAPFEEGAYNTGTEALGVAVAGNYAYVAFSSDGLRIIDVSDPTNLTEVGVLDTRVNANDVAVSGNYAYVADTGYFVVVDVSDPTNPVKDAELRSSVGLVLDVVVSDELVYLTVGSGGLRVLDVSTASDPQVIGRHTAGDHSASVAVRDDYAYVAGFRDGLRVLDVSSLSAPLTVGRDDTPRGAGDVELGGDYAFVTDQSALRVVDISDPAVPVEVGVYQPGDYVNSVVVRGDFAYIANHFSGLRVVDVSDPSVPVGIGVSDTPGRANDVALSGDYAYVTDGPEGLRIIDISDPATPFEVGSYTGPALTTGVDVSGDYAYVTVDEDGLVILDVSDPAAPVEVGLFNKGIYWANDVKVSGRYAFVAYGVLGLRVVDVLDPANPVEVGFYDTGWEAVGVTVHDDLLYVPDSSNGVYILEYVLPIAALHLDIKPGSCPNPLNIKPYTKEYKNGKPPKGVLPVALLGSAELDVHDVDVSSLLLEGVAPLRHSYEDVATPANGDDCACTEEEADGHTDLTLKFSRADIVAAFGDARGTVPLTLTGTLLDGTDFEATDCVQVHGGKDDGDGPSIMTRPDHEKVPVELKPAIPNPFNPVTRIAYSISETQHVRLVVYNVRGERVTTLVNRRMPAGAHVVTWEAAGMSSGVYFYRIEAGGHVETRKMILLK